MINFKSIPFLRIVFPYIVGILFTFQFGSFKNTHLLCAISFSLLIITFVFQKYYRPVLYLKKGFYIFSVNVFLFLLASESCFLYNARNYNNHYSHHVVSGKQSLIGIINDLPVVTEKSIKLSVQLNNIEQNNKWHYATGNVIVYVKNDPTKRFAVGNSVFINSTFGYVNEPKNPEEFNYKSFLEDRNIFHTIYAKPDQITVVSDDDNEFSFTRLGAKTKGYFVSVLRNSGLSQQAFSICSALLVGYDNEIGSDVMQSFSHSGTLHVLSVSGMHTGVLYTVLVFCFAFFDKHDKYKKTKCFFVIVALLLFVGITGFSPSVLRAVLMLSLIILGKTFYKQGNSYNTLLLSAFLLLLYNPFLIKDVGFLLSYLAVFGIMYLYPILRSIYFFENKIAQFFWDTVLLSIAATLFTLPVSLYFFHQFPVWFILSNLIIIPASFVLMGGAVLILVFYKIVIVNQTIVYLVNGCTSLMLWFAELTDNPTYGFIDYISFSKLDLVYCSLTIFLFLVIVSGKQYKHVLAFCSVCIIWLLSSIFSNYNEQTQNELLIFHVKHKSVMALRVGQNVYANFNDITDKEFQRFVKPYLLTISNPKIITTECNMLKYESKTILNVAKAGTYLPELKPDYIVVSNNADIELTTAYKNKPVIIADCSNSYKFVQQLEQQCKQLDLQFYIIKEQGAFQKNI